MDVKVYLLPPVDTNAFLLRDFERGEALLIDAPLGLLPSMKEDLGDLKLVAMLMTHGHFDHTMGAAEIVEAYGCPVYGHVGDKELYEYPEVQRSFLPPELPLAPVKINRWLEHRETLEFLGHQIEVRHVDGHTPGGILFYFPARQEAYVGDTLFMGGIGRTDLPGGDRQTLERAIREQVYTLPDECAIHPGHGPSTKVINEKRGNPFVQA